MFQVCPGDFGTILSQIFQCHFFACMISMRFEHDTPIMALKHDKMNIGFVPKHVHTSFNDGVVSVG